MLRLVAPSSVVGEYTHIMNEDIIVKKNSKIGLLNCALPLSVKKIVLDATNNKIQFKVRKTGVLRDVFLTPGNYNNEEFVDLLNKHLNSALDFRTIPSDGGFQHNFEINDDGKLEWQIARVYLESTVFPVANIKDLTITGATRIIKRSNASADFKAFAFTDEFFIGSCGTYRCKLLALGLLIFGLSNEQADPTIMNPTDYEHGIYINIVTGLYQYIYDGKLYDTTVVPTINDILSFDLNLGALEYNIYRADVLFETLHTVVDFDFDLQLNAAVSLHDNAGSISKCQWTKDPFMETTSDGVGYDSKINKKTNVKNYNNMTEVEALGAIPTPSNRHATRQFTYNFPQPKLATMCGFTILTKSTSLNEHAFVATNALDDSNTPANVIIELVNIPLETYDSRTHKRRNIVAIIPSLSLQNNKLVYDASPPIMLNMNNKYELNMREVSVRVLNIQDELLLLESPGAEITLLIEDSV